eukprot:scaffold128_cov328-Pavlova_lutheri.AAC.24
MEEDDRFVHARTDPRFRRLPKEQRKVAVDARFRDAIEGKGLFRTERAKVDKRGAPVRENAKGNRKAEGGKYYRLEEQEDGKTKAPEEGKEDATEDEEEQLEYMGIRFSTLEEKQRYLRLRGLDGNNEEEEEDEDTSGSEAEFSDAVSESTDSGGEEVWGVGAFAGSLYGVTKHEENIPDIEEETNRLAIVDMDWDRVKAVDLFAALHSFVPKRGILRSVTIYPSDYGLERMKEEELKGPSIFRDQDESKRVHEDDSSSGEDVEDVKLRAYERSKLRYYYAIAEFDSRKTAAVVYNECDGMEFEKTATKFDLRYVPSEQDFSGREIKERACELPVGYEAPVFETKSLQHSKPQLTWDADDEPRKQLLKKKLSEDAIKDEDLKAYIASTEEESEEDATEDLSAKAAALRDLLMKGERERADKEWAMGEGASEEDGNMEITFDSGLENLSKRILEEKRDEKKKEGESVWQTYMRRKKEKAKSRKGGKRGDSSDEDNSDDMYVDNPAHDDAKQLSEDEFFMDEKRRPVVENSGRRGRKKEELAEARRQHELELLMLDDNHLHDIAQGNSKPTEIAAQHQMSRRAPKTSKKKKNRRNVGESEEEDNVDLNKKASLKIDVDDPRFAALYASHHYALDPTDPRYKKESVAVKQITEERLKRRKVQVEPHESQTVPSKSDNIGSDVKAMVMSLKTKDKRQKLRKQLQTSHKA